MKAINPSLAQFTELLTVCAGGPVPFVVRLPNDQHTPVSVYANLQAANTHAFILESVETGLRLGRYSFLGAAPRKILSCHNSQFIVTDSTGRELERKACTDPLAELEQYMAPYAARWPATLDLPPLVGGVVGYLGYDCVHYFEAIGDMLRNELDMPEMAWMVTDIVVCFDHLHAQIMLCKCILPDEIEGQDIPALYDQLVAEFEDFAAAYLQPAQLRESKVRDVLQEPELVQPPDLTSNVTEVEYKEIVQRAKEHIQAGDIFQVVPSQRFSMPLTVSALDVYRSLRKINPSSYMFALKLGDHEAVGTSPETQLQCLQGHLMMRPLAGTRHRTNERDKDIQLAAELLQDEKECAEHRMLVDLVRNDLGRVAKVGSVTITRLLEVEHYSHVMHITSQVEADLAATYSCYDALRATFPAGTLSGAPKVRAMQLINEFESVRRNLYGGLVGYIDFAGNCDSCIAIRMMVAVAGRAYVQAGGGLVADSEPQAEFQETVSKATAVLTAIAMAKSAT